MKRVLAMALSLVLVLGLTLSGTIAYLTDTDAAVNVMTVGNVDIEQLENGKPNGGFDHGQPLYPAYYEGSEIDWGTAVGTVEKEVTVENIGKSEAYVRTVFAFEAGSITAFEDFQSLILTQFADGVNPEWVKTGVATIDNEKYFLASYVYPAALSVDTTSTPSLLKVAMNKAATNKDVTQFGDDYKVLVVSQAVQTENLNSLGSPAAALNEAFGAITTTNHPWTDAGTLYTIVSSNAELKEAIEGGVTLIQLAASNEAYSMPSTGPSLDTIYTGKQFTIVGEGEDTVMEVNVGGGKYQTLAGADIVFDNLTIVNNGNDECGYAHTKRLTFNNCTIKNQMYLYSTEGDTFNDCTFVNSNNNYNVWTYSSNPATFDNCVFNNTYGKAILVYRHGGTDNLSTIVNDCVFFAKNSAYTWDGQWVAAIEIDSSLAPCTVEINNCETVDLTYNGLVRHKKGEAATITVDGQQVTSDKDNPIGKTDSLEINTAEALFAFAEAVNNGNSYAKKTIKLTADIDLENADWKPIGQTGATEFKGIFDGNGKTIYNMNINSENETSGHYSSGLFGWIESQGQDVTIKNVTIDGAMVKGHHNVAAIAGYLEGDSVVENCHVKNATLINTCVNEDACGDKTGAIAGYAAGDVTIKNCSASDCQIIGIRDAGQLVGASYVKPDNWTATNVTVSEADGVCYDNKKGQNIRNELIGRVLYS